MDSSETVNFDRSTVVDLGRLEALTATQLLDSPPEPAFDRLTAFAAKLLGVPAALITLIDKDRQFFKSQCGLGGELATKRQGPLSHSVCRYVVEGGKPLLVQDAREHAVLRHNPGVRESGVVAYAGIPLIDTRGHRLGTFCVFDSRRRDWTPAEVDLLRSFAAQAMTEIELRTAAARLDEHLSTAQTRESNRRTLTQLSLHDLRTPLNALLLALEMMPELGALSEVQAEYLQLCIRSAETLRGVADRLLDVELLAERGAAGLSCRACDPVGLAARACEQAEALARDKSIGIERDFPPTLPRIDVDAEKWERALVNLLAHAIKFAPEASRVCLRVETALPEELNVVFTIHYKNAGLSAAGWARVLEDETNLGDTAPGGETAALGLVYCKRIAAAHRGKIWATLDTSETTLLHLSLPAGSRRARLGEAW